MLATSVFHMLRATNRFFFSDNDDISSSFRQKVTSRPLKNCIIPTILYAFIRYTCNTKSLFMCVYFDPVIRKLSFQALRLLEIPTVAFLFLTRRWASLEVWRQGCKQMWWVTALPLALVKKPGNGSRPFGCFVRWHLQMFNRMWWHSMQW